MPSPKAEEGRRSGADEVDHAALIDALGGRSKVAELLTRRLGFDISPSQVSNWRRRGVAWHVRPTIAAEARRRGIALPYGFLHHGTTGAYAHGELEFPAGPGEELAGFDPGKGAPTRRGVSAPSLRSRDDLEDLRVGPNGNIELPQRFLDAAGMRETDVIEARLEGDEIRLIGRKAAIRRAQEFARRHVPPGVSLVDELIDERLREAALEDEEGQ